MKRIIPLAVSLMLVICCFTACGNSKKIDGAELYTDFGGDEYQVVTDESGDIERDEEGNLIIAVTGEDGKQVTDESGEKVTETQQIDHALVINNTIELQNYYVTIPNGWSNNSSYTGVQLKKDSNGDSINIDFLEDKDIVETQDNCHTIINAAISNYENTESISKSVEINGVSCQYFGAYVPKDSNGNPFYIAYALYETDEGIYRFLISGNRNIEDDFSEISSVIGSVQFK